MRRTAGLRFAPRPDAASEPDPRSAPRGAPAGAGTGPRPPSSQGPARGSKPHEPRARKAQRRLRLLFLTEELPYPPHGGAAVRIWSLLRALGAEHQVELLSFGREGQEVPAPLAQLCTRVELVPSPVRGTRWQRLARYLMGQASLVPWMVQEWKSPLMARRVAELAVGTDAVVAVLLGMSQYLEQVQEPLRVYDAHNLEHAILEQVAQHGRSRLRRMHAAREARRVRQYERWVCRETDLVVAVTGPDALGLAGLSSDAVVRAVPISLVVEEYPDLWQQGDPKLCFFGDLAWLPNVDAALYLHAEVLPRVRGRLGRNVPELVLAGRRPAPEVQALAGSGVRVTGFVPDLREVLRGDTLVVVPLRAGGGMRVKILEAMAWGLPVVSTTLGCAGIDHGGALVEANGAATLASELVRLLTDPAARRRLGAAGRARVAALYGHTAAGRRFVDALREVQSQ